MNEEFRSFERAGWQGIGDGYHDFFGDLTSQAVPHLLAAVDAQPGRRVLDVATGPGYAARAAAALGAEVVAVDFSPAMLRLARRLGPGIDFREGDAEALDLPGASFDGVITSFGLLHLAEPEKAVSEAWRVLRPDGRYAFTVWAKPERAILFGIILGAIQQHGDLKVPLPPGPSIFRFSEADECRRVLEGAGFTNVSVDEVPQTCRIRSADQLLDALLESTVRNAALLRAQTPEALRAIRAAVAERAESYRRGDLLELPAPAVLAAATKP